MQKSTANQSQYLLQSVDNALRLLNLFSGEDRLSLTEIAARMGCGKTIAYRLAYTLESRGFLCRGEDGKYSLGMRLFTLGQKVLSEKSYLPLVVPLLDQLTQTVNESTHLVTWESLHHVILLYESLPNQSLRVEMSKAISSRPPHLTSTGLALLATKTDDEIREYANTVIFEKKTTYSISSKEQLDEDIRFTREHGYVINNQRFEEGAISIAVPIFKRGGTSADFSISVSGPSTRMTARQDTILKELFSTAQKISALL